MCIYLSLNCCAEYWYTPSYAKQVLFVCFTNNYGHSSKIKRKTDISNVACITSLDAMLSELLFKVTLSVVTTLEKLGFAVVVCCLAICLWFPQLTACFHIGYQHSTENLQIPLWALDHILRTSACNELLMVDSWGLEYPLRDLRGQNSWQEEGLVICAAEKVILLRRLVCPKLFSRLPFSVNSCLLNCFVSNRGSV